MTEKAYNQEWKPNANSARDLAIDQAASHLRKLEPDQVTTVCSVVGSIFAGYGAGGPAMMDIPDKKITRWLWGVTQNSFVEFLKEGSAGDTSVLRMLPNDPYMKYEWVGATFLDEYGDTWEKDIAPWALEQEHTVDCNWNDIAKNMINIVAEAVKVSGIDRSIVIDIEERLGNRK